MTFNSTWMAAPRYRDFVAKGEPRKAGVGLTVLQHHLKVALLLLRLRIRQRQTERLSVFLLILHHHRVLDAFWSCVIQQQHGVVVHGGHAEVPLHLLVIRELSAVVC